jgi:hypothetical protein
MPGGNDFDGLVLDEKGFVVEFSNRGAKLKKDYCRFRNPDGETVKCAIDGCTKMTRARSGVCTTHNTEHQWMLHKRDWLARIIPPGGTRDEYLTNAPGFGDLSESLIRWAGEDRKKIDRLDEFFFEAIDAIPGEIPDSTSLQKGFEGIEPNILSPQDIITMTLKTVNRYFPKNEFMAEETENIEIVAGITKKIPLRLVASLLFLGYVCEEANRGDRWYKTKNGTPESIMYAGCFMSAGYYLYRRFTKATPKQARMSLKG